MKFRLALCAFALAAVAVPASAQTLKPGLWAVTNKGSGNPEVEEFMKQQLRQMDRMPPAERKRLEESMADQNLPLPAADGSITQKICLTQEMVERDLIVEPGSIDCKITYQPRVGNAMKTSSVCTDPPSKGEAEFKILGTEGFQATAKIVSSAPGKPQLMTVSGSGKWLGADCGNVKPGAMPKK